MYLMVQVILVFFLRTEPAVILLCAAVLAAPELVRSSWVNSIMGKLKESVAGSDTGFESELQLLKWFVVLTED